MDGFSVVALTVISILASVFWCSWKFKKSKEGTAPYPPGPRGLPILGYLPFLHVNLHHQFTELAKKYGPIYKLQLGSKLCMVISSPALIKEVVRDQDTIFANRDPPVAAIAATGGLGILWAPYGPYWRDMRKLFVRQMLSNNNLQASYVLRKEEVAKVVRDVSKKIGKPIEIGEMVFITELNVILSLLWGGTIDAEMRDRLGAEFRDKVSKLVDLLGKPNVSDYFPVLAKFDVQGIEKKMRAVVPGVEEILDSVIDERMKMIAAEGGKSSAGRAKDFLGILLDLKEQKVGEGSSFGLTQIKAILMDIVLGGTDTTATIVEWVMAELLHNPDIMKKVQEELTDVIGENNAAEEFHITKLHYLDAVVKETFRLHPPLPLLIPRFPSQSCVVGGYMIPKHSQVFLNMWAISMDPQIWENPSEFRPDRFLKKNGNFDYMGSNVQYLPFGSGRRVCPALPLGEKMVMYLLATLLHTFEWCLPERETVDVSEKFGIVMRKKTPLFAIPYNRF
ncbi:cytochrome P450 76C2-like [Sesamum indicum]|uniref:Cytochrome P450 76C2-like n=1 Tax=Sesamum indicum TaxID=4182 RepID=A0A6I9SLN6_SESIN|nr:cytochrome P450 76C2-like [Sesamum indicum]